MPIAIVYRSRFGRQALGKFESASPARRAAVFFCVVLVLLAALTPGGSGLPLVRKNSLQPFSTQCNIVTWMNIRLGVVPANA